MLNGSQPSPDIGTHRKLRLQITNSERLTEVPDAKSSII